jgi:ectoine hydroxylase-related dioxygenase (phytanoyl-CoA dioxygenase family)
VHSDLDFWHPHYFPFAYVININLVDVSPENGATELWLGSHHVSTMDEHVNSRTADPLVIKPRCREERRKHSPPIQPTIKKGSLMIRDLRLWHAGMPNKTDEPRIVLAFVVQPAWYQAKNALPLPENVKEHVESWGDEMQFQIDWVKGDVDHLNLNLLNLDMQSESPVFEHYGAMLAKRADSTPRWY